MAKGHRLELSPDCLPPGLPPLHMEHKIHLLHKTVGMKFFKADMIHISITGL